MQSINLITHRVGGALDRFNDRYTSYRLMLYFLLALVGWAVIGNLSHQLTYSWDSIILGAAWLCAVCWATNRSIGRFLNIPTNRESDLITALILSLIFSSPHTAKDFAVLTGAGIAAIASKFLIVVYNSHIFNPAAAGAFIAGLAFHQYASWWVGTKFMSIAVVLGGILILRKMNRFSLVLVFLATYILWLIWGSSSNVSVHMLWLELVSTQVLFFAIVMLTEPLTSPRLLNKSLLYGVVVGALYSVTKLRLSPEEALLIGNILTFIIAPNRRYKLHFMHRITEANGIHSYVFKKPNNLKYLPGQYMEWTLSQNRSDSRGNRRYLTIASAPTEDTIMFTVKVPENASAFKQSLEHYRPGQTILASHLSGDFVLPTLQDEKLAFLAGGVGITPFRSMIKFLVDNRRLADINLLYAANSVDEVAFHKLFKHASIIGLKSNYLIKERITDAKINEAIPDYLQRHFYISGPYPFVNASKAALLTMGVNTTQITTDYFPGYGG